MKEEDGIARALLASVRQWIAAFGMAGALLAIIYLFVMAKLASAAAIIGLALGVLGIVSGVVGIRDRHLLGWLLAVASVGLAIAAFALVAVAPGRG